MCCIVQCGDGGFAYTYSDWIHDKVCNLPDCFSDYELGEIDLDDENLKQLEGKEEYGFVTHNLAARHCDCRPNKTKIIKATIKSIRSS